ncbi:NADH-quinone oxidoreductase subunit G [Puniceicoccus vermicola]|uniref:(2Fe-2S)-binding protein n=1 Tax=Puniceicoccus vermicola TaxID=388746 RepID=A0A7X1E3A7_9BACT|nr:2Fe-2S iron-sulfur cluster-binding protein [Puniceicoccus vermicola]MBC2600769.1 (2Fe-2S)-binding protein [Puniceicoccus vermicola]
MSEKGQTEKVTVNIDGKDVEVPTGITMIEAAEIAGKEIPHYCYHPKLSISGNCRMCLVEMGMPMRDRGTGEPVMDDDGKQKIGWMPKPAIACNSKVSPGLHIKTDTDLVKDCRNGVMEFLLVNHPLDCPICDQAGECRLQEFATDYGRGYSRFIEEKNVKPKRTVLGPRVMLDDERCILCSRCIRFMSEVADDPVLGFTERGSYSTLTCFPGKNLDSNYSLNTVDICPVGALTSRDFRFKMRVWFLKSVKSICTESSVGANTEVWQREGKIYRITPRRNDAVNDTWMTDSGRALYQQVEAEGRLRQPVVKGSNATATEAVRAAGEILKSSEKIAIVASTHSSVEEQYYLSQLARSKKAKVFAVQHLGEEDGLLQSADRTPNTRGSLVTGLLSDLPSADLSDLASQIDSGAVDTVLAVHEDLVAAGLTEAQIAKVQLIQVATQKSASTALAAILIPSLTVFERSGSFINQQFRLQKFHAVIPGPAGLLSDLQIFASLKSLVEGETAATVQVKDAWNSLSSEIEELQGIQFRSIPDDGQTISAGNLANLPFPEKKSLKFDAREFAREAIGVSEAS